MAKKWTPTQRQLSAYDELLRRQNEVRKHLLKRRRIAEEEGVGRSLPDLIIPKKARRYRDLSQYRFDSYKEYREARQRLSRLFGGKSPLARFYEQSYKRNILDILKDWIETKFNYTEPPADYKQWNSKEATLYSDIQINNADKGLARLLQVYNDVVNLSAKEFMAFYDLKLFPSLHVIYDDITGDSSSAEVDMFINEFERDRKKIYKSDAFRHLQDVEEFIVKRGLVQPYAKGVKNRSEERKQEIQAWLYKDEK